MPSGWKWWLCSIGFALMLALMSSDYDRTQSILRGWQHRRQYESVVCPFNSDRGRFRRIAQTPAPEGLFTPFPSLGKGIPSKGRPMS